MLLWLFCIVCCLFACVVCCSFTMCFEVFLFVLFPHACCMCLLLLSSLLNVRVCVSFFLVCFPCFCVDLVCDCFVLLMSAVCSLFVYLPCFNMLSDLGFKLRVVYCCVLCLCLVCLFWDSFCVSVTVACLCLCVLFVLFSVCVGVCVYYVFVYLCVFDVLLCLVSCCSCLCVLSLFFVYVLYVFNVCLYVLCSLFVFWGGGMCVMLVLLFDFLCIKKMGCCSA